MRDFIGLCVHTVLFKPELYRPVCSQVRDYHGFDWDVGNDTAFAPAFPFARNRVDWGTLYGGWRKAGYGIDVCVMFGNTPPGKWKDLPRDAFAYGKAFAGFFGPSRGHGLAQSVEIGNEPGHYDDPTYRTLFENMAKGLRAGDPKLRIATCAMEPGPSHKYAKSLECVKGLDPLFDIITVHAYAQVEGWPTWRRSFPEDPAIDYLARLRKVIAWRDAEAPGKAIWVTEFGWDASTKPAPATGDFKKWQGSTETQQAQWLVRSFLVFAAMDLDRAFIYFFNDDDTPHVHGSSGLTRKFQPKPAFHAVAHLQQTLGACRLTRVVTQTAALCDYEFADSADPAGVAAAPGRVVRVLWSPTGAERSTEVTVDLGGARLVKAEQMPLSAAPAPAPSVTRAGGSAVRLTVDESPVYLWLER